MSDFRLLEQREVRCPTSERQLEGEPRDRRFGALTLRARNALRPDVAWWGPTLSRCVSATPCAQNGAYPSGQSSVFDELGDHVDPGGDDVFLVGGDEVLTE